MQPILRYSKNNKQLFCVVPKWLTSYLVIYVINQWSTAFGPVSNPSVFEVLYLVKYSGGFKYFISHNIKSRFKNAVTLMGVLTPTYRLGGVFSRLLSQFILSHSQVFLGFLDLDLKFGESLDSWIFLIMVVPVTLVH